VIAAADFLELARTRRSIRRFQERIVTDEVLEQLVEAAVWAPSAGMRQDWFFTCVVSETLKRRMAEAVRRYWQESLDASDGAVVEALRIYSANFDWFASAPALIAVSSAKTEAFMNELLGAEAALVAGRNTSAAMAAQNLMLAAHAFGLGTCCLTGPVAAHHELEKLLNMERKRALVCVIAVGYPAEYPVAPARKPLEQVMRILK